MAESQGQGADPFQNIEKTEKGYLLSEAQIIKLANYIAKLQAENERLQLQLEQALVELEKAYNENQTEDIIQRVGDGLTGAGLAALIVLIAQGLGD